MLKHCIFIWLFIQLSEGTKRSCPPIDLTRPFNNDTVAWQDSDRFQFTNQIAIEEPNGDWFAINDYKASEHAGTHIDAPYLFVKNGWKVGDIPLSHLVTKGIKIDLSQEADYNVALLPRHLIAWENKYGRIPNNCIILVYFDWGKYYYNRIAYFGGTRPSDYKFPGVSKEAAEWIVTHRKIVGIGIDTPSIDPGKITNFLTHKIFLNNSIYNLENVNIPKSLPADQFMLIVMPMYIEKGSGAPVRIVAFLKRCWLDL